MQGIVRPFGFTLWQFGQLALFISFFSAQYVLHVQLSSRLNDALTRLGKLEHWIDERGKHELQPRPYDIKHSRGKRNAEQDQLITQLWNKIKSLENRIAASDNNSTTGGTAFCVQGPQGRNGMPGKNGIPGRDGKDGMPGRDGRDGTDGRDGIPGVNGIPGRHGSPGRDGASGPKGEQGHKGHRGKPGPKGPPGNPVICHNNPAETQRNNEKTSGSSVFIRWGRAVCPNRRGTVLVYEGRVAGSQSTHQGEGGANYICLPLNPEYNKPITEGYHPRASLFGVEYGHVEDLFARMGQGPQISYLGVPCAVCRAEKRGSLMMIPARNVCPTRQWTREYQGYLMTDSSNGTRQEYICVDNDATGVNALHSKGHSGKALLTSVLGKCGVLPCPPYEQDRELTCAVCTM